MNLEHMNASRAVLVTPSDATNIAFDAMALYIGVTGNVAVVTPFGDVVTFTGVPSGSILPVKCRRVNATNTTATAIVAMS